MSRPRLPPDQRRPRTSGPSGRHRHPTAEEHARAVALLDLVRWTLLPAAPELLTVRAVEARLGLPRGAIGSATAPSPDSSRRLGERARAAMETIVQADPTNPNYLQE